MRTVIFAGLVAFFSGLCGLSAYSQELIGASDPNVLATFKIGKYPSPILLPVTFGGEKLVFLLDTGSTFTLFDISFEHRLGRRTTTATLSTGTGDMRTGMYNVPEASLGPLSLEESGLVGCVDLESLRLAVGSQIHGLIGMSFLKHYVLQMDFDNGRLSLLKPTKTKNPNWGVEIPIIYGRNETPLVKANVLDTMETYFVIDTGCLESNGLAKEMLDYILLAHKMRTIVASAHVGFGVVSARVYRITHLSLGPFEYENLLFRDDFVSSRLGLSFWSRHTVTLDFPNSKVYLKKGKDFQKTYECDMSGLGLRRSAGKTSVDSVSSPAEKAGIKEGDTILEVNGRKADPYELWELQQLMRSQNGREIRLTIKRGDTVKEISFVLKRRI